MRVASRLPALVSIAVLLSAEGGCHRDARRTVGTPEGLRSIAATPAPTHDASSEDPRAIVRAWSDAIDRHDLHILENLYAEHVRFYGSELPRPKVLQAKTAALSKGTFHQRIVGHIVVTPREDGSIVAEFMKLSGPGDNTTSIRAKLVLKAGDGGALLVVEETDEVTEGDAPRPDCEGAAARVVNSLREVKQIVASANGAARQSEGRTHLVGGIGPNDDGNGGFTWALGVHSDERFEALVSWTVDRAGHLTVSTSGADPVVPPAALREVERACKR